MKKILIVIAVLGLLAVFFFPKESALNSKRKCLGFVGKGAETTDAPPGGPSVSNPNICFGILLGPKTVADTPRYPTSQENNIVY
jgi:hypothetical protein